MINDPRGIFLFGGHPEERFFVTKDLMHEVLRYVQNDGKMKGG